MRALIAIIVLVISTIASAAPTTQPAPRRVGPSAESLRTGYSGPLKFNPRVLAAERAMNRTDNHNAREATRRYYYSAPIWGYYFGGYGYYGFRGFGFPSGVSWRGEY